MTKSSEPVFKLYKLGLRVAVYAAFFSAAIIFLLLWAVFDFSLEKAGALTAIFWGVIFLVVYVTSFLLQYRRLEVLEQISKNLSKKRFEEYVDVRTTHNDEIDYLIKHLIKSSRTVEREIQRLNRIENYRKEFIGDISHELKTPIFAIQGFIETLLNGALEDETVNKEFLRKAMRNVNRLIYLTKDLMEISKLETGELKSEKEIIYLYDTIHEVSESLNYKAQKERVTLVIEEIQKSLQVKADRNQVKQILINLIENGIKYNVPGGKVVVGVQPYKKDPERILLFVQDTGIGIDENDIPRVTERFFRVDKSRSRERGGTGLGLSIVKHIIEAHGEHFFIDSVPNKGSTFSITLKKIEPNKV